MTGPFAGGGRTFTLNPGDLPTQLTETADGDTRVINRSDSQVYLGSDSGIDANTGVPLDPLTSIPWSSDGQIWAVADPAATDPALIVLTSAISDWTPSPAAIAAQVLKSGIPNVILTETIANAVVIPVGTAQTFDVTQYASAIVMLSYGALPLGQYLAVIYTQRGPNGTTTDRDTLFAPFARIALVGTKLILSNTNPSFAVDVTVTILATNRPLEERLDVRLNAAAGDHWQRPTNALVAGVFTSLGNVTPNVQLQGEVDATFRVSAGMTGEFRLDYAGFGQTVCDTSEMRASSDGATLILNRRISIPAADYAFGFIPHTTGNAGFTVDMVPA